MRGHRERGNHLTVGFGDSMHQLASNITKSRQGIGVGINYPEEDMVSGRGPEEPRPRFRRSRSLQRERQLATVIIVITRMRIP